jgi:glycosyltransferase involved in cell wall biosynthesis
MTFLTIAVPTYNRLEYLKELLPELLRQCHPYPEIELFISDNCTTDGSFSYIQDLANYSAQLHFNRNNSNVGGDENFIRCVEYSHGDYVWIFGDDEILCEGAIACIIDILKSSPVSLLISGIGQGHEFIWCGKYTDFLGRNKPRTILNHSLITCNIFKKEIFDPAIARSRRKTNFGHMYAILDSLKNGAMICVTSAPIFNVRTNRAPFEKKPKFIWIKYVQLFLHMELPYSKITYFICFDLVGATILRQLRRVQGINKN